MNQELLKRTLKNRRIELTAYNSRCNPTRRWHASGGRNWDNRDAICRAIEKEWGIKNKN